MSSIKGWPGSCICAEGIYAEGDGEAGKEKLAGIFIGPEFGTVMVPVMVCHAMSSAGSFRRAESPRGAPADQLYLADVKIQDARQGLNMSAHYASVRHGGGKAADGASAHLHKRLDGRLLCIAQTVLALHSKYGWDFIDEHVGGNCSHDLAMENAWKGGRGGRSKEETLIILRQQVSDLRAVTGPLLTKNW